MCKTDYMSELHILLRSATNILKRIFVDENIWISSLEVHMILLLIIQLPKGQN